MIEVIVKHKGANEIMDIVRELRQQGLIQGKDFDFSFSKAVFDNDSYEAVTPKQTVFMFHTEKYATLFALRYAT